MEEHEEVNLDKNESERGFLSIINPDFSYFSQRIGRIKLVQLVSVLLVGCFLPNSISVFFSMFSFYAFVTWTSFMYICIDLLVHVTSIRKLIPNSQSMPTLLFYVDLIAGVVWLISSCLIADVTEIFPDGRKALSAVACTFGIITTILFFVEAYFHYLSSVNGKGVKESSIAKQGLVSNQTECARPFISRPVGIDD